MNAVSLQSGFHHIWGTTSSVRARCPVAARVPGTARCRHAEASATMTASEVFLAPEAPSRQGERHHAAEVIAKPVSTRTGHAWRCVAIRNQRLFLAYYPWRNIQSKRLGRTRFESFNRDCSHHGVIGAQRYWRNVQFTAHLCRGVMKPFP